MVVYIMLCDSGWVMIYYAYSQLNFMLDISEANAFFDRIATERGVDCPSPRTTTRLLDKVSLTYLR